MTPPAASTVTRRLFFALWPDPAPRSAMAAAADVLCAGGVDPGRRIAPARYHLTLRFLGETAAGDAQLCAAAASVRAGAFTLRLDVAGSFDAHETVWWLGASAPPPELLQLWQQLGEALQAQQLPLRAEPALVPHVTFARGARSALDAAAARFEPVDWPVGDFALIESRSRPRPQYCVLQRWPLRAARRSL